MSMNLNLKELRQLNSNLEVFGDAIGKILDYVSVKPEYRHKIKEPNSLSLDEEPDYSIVVDWYDDEENEMAIFEICCKEYSNCSTLLGLIGEMPKFFFISVHTTTGDYPWILHIGIKLVV